MKIIFKRVAWTIGVVWAAFSFFASNSPAEVNTKAGGWLSLPILQSIAKTTTLFAGSPIVVATTFFVSGLLVGWRYTKWKLSRAKTNWSSSLASDLAWLAFTIGNINPRSDMHSINADIDVVRVKVEAQGLPFPKIDDGFRTADSLLPYLARVSAHLKAGHIEDARSVATQYARHPTT